jgi:putative phosphoribosyl transferase
VEAATLLIVGGVDRPVIALNRHAFRRLGATEKSLEIVPGAGHLFEEPGALDRVADMACDWFGRHLSWDGDGERALAQASPSSVTR